jgi:glycosyltransferase involved in cell wall biosynthesis
MPTPCSSQATAVIPAFNEEAHIENLLQLLLKVPALKQIVVVDDASTDKTAAIVSTYVRQDNRIQLVRLAENQGKGGAIMAGINASDPELLILLDADLLNLQPAHVEALVQPVAQGHCDMSLGLFQNGRLQTNWTHNIFYFLSGQRCLRWSAFKQATTFHNARWGIEMALNLVAWQRNLVVKHVPWNGVSHVMRLEKLNGFGKYWTYVEMWKDILTLSARFGWQQWRANGRAKRVRRLAHRQLPIGE